MNNHELMRAAELSHEFADAMLYVLSQHIAKVSEHERDNIDPNMVLLHTLALVNAKILKGFVEGGMALEFCSEKLKKLSESYAMKDGVH